MNWKIEYHNDVSNFDDCFVEWWTVETDERSFRCACLADAVWLVERLNSHRMPVVEQKK